MKYEIILDKNLLNNKDIDFFHYGETYEFAKCELGIFYITSCGELKCEYTDEKNNISTRNYDDIVNYYVRNNNEFLQALDLKTRTTCNGTLEFNMQNWFTLELVNSNGRYCDTIDSYDLVYGSISECLEDFKHIMEDKDFINDLKEGIREV